MKTINIVYAGGYWATNMGNAFYGLGVQYLLNAANPNANIHVISDHVQYAWNRYNARNANSWSSLRNLKEVDYLIFAGPMLSPSYLRFWNDTLINAEKWGTKIILLSAGCSQYSEEEKKEVEQFLKGHHFYALFTRDEETYLNFRAYFDYSYNGICCAFYIPEYFKSYPLDISHYVVYNFETYIEPDFRSTPSKSMVEFDFKGTKYYRGRELKKIKKTRMGRKYADTLGEYQIIRTKHSLYPPVNMYRGGGVYLSDVPYEYLNIYANAEAVFSDRVHACVAALAQGTPAMLFNTTKRSKLLERVYHGDLEDIYTHPITIDLEYIDAERKMQIEALRRILK